MNKVIFITGASQGIGWELAKQHAEQGDRVVAAARNYDALLKLKENSSNIEIIECDVRVYDEVKRSIEFTINQFGRLDIAYLNAAISGRNSIHDFDIDSFKTLFETNVYGVVNGLSILVPLMKKQGGGVIAGVSSLADVRGFPVSGPYSSSKAALTTLLESVRLELKNTNIKVVTIKPGFVITPMTNKNDFFMPQLMNVEKAVKIIIKQMEQGKDRISFPRLLTTITYFIKIMPNSLFEFLQGIANKTYLKKSEFKK